GFAAVSVVAVVGSGFGVSTSSATSDRNSPSDVNSRRSVTVKLDSFFLSAIASSSSQIDQYLLCWTRNRGTLVPRQQSLRNRQRNDRRLHTADHHLAAWIPKFAANVSQRDRFFCLR